MDTNEPKKEEGISSQFVEKPAFDYDKYRDETTIKAVTAIFKILGNNAERLSYNSKSTGESILEAEKIVEAEMIEAIIVNRVPEGDMETLIQTFQVVLHRLFDSIARMKKEYEREFLARTLGARNPDGHFSREFSTLDNLYVGLEKIRSEQKDDPHGYFYPQSKPIE